MTDDCHESKIDYLLIVRQPAVNATKYPGRTAGNAEFVDTAPPRMRAMPL
jgi:hypothetical protein